MLIITSFDALIMFIAFHDVHVCDDFFSHHLLHQCFLNFFSLSCVYRELSNICFSSQQRTLALFFHHLLFFHHSLHFLFSCNFLFIYLVTTSLSIPIVCLESYLLLLVAFDVFPMLPNVPHHFFDVIQCFPKKTLPSLSFPKVSPTSLIVL